MNAEIYDALIAAGAPVEKAQTAAVALAREIQDNKSETIRVEKQLTANLQNTKSDLKNEIQRVEKELKAEIQDVKAEVHSLDKSMAVIKWMLGVVIAATVIPLVHTYL